MALDYKSGLSRYRRYLQLVQTKPAWSASLWVILSLILLIVLTWMALRPTLVTISGLFGQIKQNHELSDRLDKKIMTVHEALKNMAAAEKDLPLLEAMLPSDPEWERVADNLYRAATSSGLTIKRLEIDRIARQAEPEKTAKDQANKPASLVPTGLIPVKFSLEAEGEYTQMIETVKQLEKLPRVLVFSEVAISTTKEGALTLRVAGEAAFNLKEGET